MIVDYHKVPRRSNFQLEDVHTKFHEKPFNDQMLLANKHAWLWWFIQPLFPYTIWTVR
jgi:hypothetical protein